MDEGADARRKARSSYAVRIYREGDAESMNDQDALDWDRIPVDDRAAFVWQLSQEVYALAHPDADVDALDRLARAKGRAGPDS